MEVNLSHNEAVETGIEASLIDNESRGELVERSPPNANSVGNMSEPPCSPGAFIVDAQDEYSPTSHTRQVEEEPPQEFTADIAVLQAMADSYNLDLEEVKRMLMATSMTTKENFKAGRSTTTTLDGSGHGRQGEVVQTVAIEGTEVSTRRFVDCENQEYGDEEMADAVPPDRSAKSDDHAKSRTLSVLRFSEGTGVPTASEQEPSTMGGPSLQSLQSDVVLDRMTPRRKKKKKASQGKKVGFGDEEEDNDRMLGVKRNLIKNVVVYQVDNQIFIDIKFERNRIGWLFILLGLLFDIINPCMTLYFEFVFQSPADTRPASAYALNFWGSVWSLLYFTVVSAMFFATKLISLKDFRWLKRYDALLLANLWGFLWGVFQLMQVWMGDYEFVELELTPQYVPTINLFLLFFLAWRRFKAQTIFFAEWVSLGCAFVGYAIVSIPHWRIFFPERWKVGLGLNLVLTLAAVIITVWFFVTEYLVKRGVAKMAVLLVAVVQILLVSMVGGLLTTTYRNNPRMNNSVFWPMFDSRWVGWGALSGFTVLGAPMFYLFASAYLDVASLASCIAVKTCLMPYAVHFIVYGQLTPTTRAIFETVGIEADRGWNIFLWLGTPLVIVGCVVIVVFASVKRQFAARRFALSPAANRKKAHGGAKQKSGNMKKSGPKLEDLIDQDDGGMTRQYVPVSRPKERLEEDAPASPRSKKPKSNRVRPTLGEY